MITRRIFVACRLSQGSFSGEAIFEVDTAACGEYVGVAPRRACRKEDGSPVGEDELPRDGSVPGRVVALLIGNGDEVARVVLPDGEAVVVSVSLVTEREAEIAHVSL